VVTVREAAREDVEAMLDLLATVVNEGVWLGSQPPFDRADRRERLVSSLADERSVNLVVTPAEGDPPVIGHLGLRVAPFGVADFGMCVAPAWRGRGVGSALVAAALDAARAKGAHKVTLQVWPHNGPARRLYRRFGFVEEGFRRGHYRRDGGEYVDAILMAYPLT
jgi:RimJ/RimL family protein N-acetyltransferase